MKNNIKNGCSLGILTSIGFLWMTTMFGGGWATGMQSFVFGGRAGWPAFVTQLVGLAAICFLSGWVTLEFARFADVWNYRSFIDSLYRSRLVGTYYDIAQFVSVPIAIGACTATFASCLKQQFGANYWLCVAIFAVIVLASTIWGNKVLGRLGTYMGTVIIVLLVVCFLFVAAEKGYIVKETVSAGATAEQWKEAWYWGAFRFWFLSGSQAINLLPILKPIKTRRDSTTVCLVSFCLCAIFIVFITFVVLAGMPGGADSSVPYLYSLQQLNHGWLNLAYVVLVSFAVITTGNTLLYSFQVRYCNLKVIKRLEMKESTKMLIVGIILIGISCLVSAFGLYAIIAKGYSYMAYLSGPITSIGIPVIGIGWLIWMKKRNMGLERGALTRYWETKAAAKAAAPSETGQAQ